MRIIFTSAEVVPFAKVGGLADVSGELPAALSELGEDLHVFLPFYRHVRKSSFSQFTHFPLPVIAGIILKKCCYLFKYYVMSRDYNKYMDIQQEINFAIKKEFETRNIEFAYPTQTLYLNK